MSLNNSSSKSHGTTCEICSVYVPNEASMNAHLKGHKHLKNVAKQEEWKKKALSSVYVGGIKNLAAAELALADYFTKFCNVKKITIDKTSKQYAIVELDDRQIIDTLVETKQHIINGVTVVVKPREVKSSVAHAQTKRLKQNENEAVLDASLVQNLFDCTTVDEQFVMLQERLQLTDDDVRLRQLLCQLLETALQEVLPNCQIKQFGSSASGFGARGCDLDLDLHYTDIHPEVLCEILSRTDDESGDEAATTITSVTDISSPDTSDVLSAVAEVIKQCVPDCHKIKSILSARLPVVRFYHKVSKMRCDLSLLNHIAVRNTEYLRFCSHCSPALRPLVFAVRLWMKHWELAGGLHTNGPRLNNYAVTLMVMFYLQSHGYLPTLEELRLSIPEKEQVFLKGWNCSFPKNLTQFRENIALKSHSLPELLAGFFNFYSKVDFAKTVIDLSTATLTPTTEFVSSLASESDSTQNASGIAKSRYRQNFKIGFLNIRDPFELLHNVSGNVNEKHLKIFTKRIRNASLACKMLRYQTKGKSKDKWGILNLFVDHHHKETSTQEKNKIGSHDGYKILIKTPDPTDVKWNLQHAAGLVISLLRDVFHIAFSNQLPNPDVSFAGDQTPPLLDSCENGDVTCQKCADDSSSDETSSRKRKASSPEPCGLCKRAKLMLSSPTASRVSSVLDSFAVELPFKSTCTATHKLWEGRRKARRRLVQEQKSDLLEIEMQVSKLLLSDHSNDDTPATESFNTSCSSTDSVSKVLFTFSLTLAKEGTDCLSVLLDSDSPSKDLLTFFHHLQIFLPTFVSKCLTH